jgi:hypothetical protein
MAQTPTEKLYDLYAENKKDHQASYLDELLEQVKLFATESNTLSKSYIRIKLKEIITDSEKTDA